MGPLFGLASAASWGIGDFAGGLSSRIGSVALAMVISQGVGFAATAAILVASGEALAPADAMLWGAVAGVAGLAGLVFFYRALAGGTMALVAPLTGVVGAAVPAAVALAGGEQVSTLRLAGLAVALASIVLIALPRDVLRGSTRTWHFGRSELLQALLGGLGFAAFFLFLHRASEAGATWWPLLAVRAVGFGVLLVGLTIIVARRQGAWRARVSGVLGLDRVRLAVRANGARAILPIFAVAGAGDLGGNVFFLFATQHDVLSVAVVLSSLYPVVTAVLAATLLGERLGRPQVAGVLLAAVAAGLIGAG